MKILSEAFFSNYIFHPFANELSTKDKLKTLITSVCLGIFTLGICHVICAIKYSNRTYRVETDKTPTSEKTDQVFNKQIYKNIDDLISSTNNSSMLLNFAKDFSWNDEEKEKILTKVTELGNSEGMRLLGLMYFEKNKVDAGIELLQQAANKGDIAACGNLANFYWTGDKVKEDKEVGKKWLQKAIDLGGVVFLNTSKRQYIKISHSSQIPE